MARILLIGGHGKVALLLEPLLVAAGHHVTAVDREEDDVVAVDSLVRFEEDLGRADEVEHLDLVEEQNADAPTLGRTTPRRVVVHPSGRTRHDARIPAFMPTAPASPRVLTSSFFRMLATWNFTVLSPMLRLAAMSLLRLPYAR